MSILPRRASRGSCGEDGALERWNGGSGWGSRMCLSAPPTPLSLVSRKPNPATQHRWQLASHQRQVLPQCRQIVLVVQSPDVPQTAHRSSQRLSRGWVQCPAQEPLSPARQMQELDLQAEALQGHPEDLWLLELLKHCEMSRGEGRGDGSGSAGRWRCDETASRIRCGFADG